MSICSLGLACFWKKYLLEFWQGLCWIYRIKLRKFAYLKILSLLTHEQGLSLHLFPSFKISLRHPLPHLFPFRFQHCGVPPMDQMVCWGPQPTKDRRCFTRTSPQRKTPSRGSWKEGWVVHTCDWRWEPSWHSGLISRAMTEYKVKTNK